MHPDADARDWGGRLPRNESLDLDDEQRIAAAQIHDELTDWSERSGFAITDTDGGLLGPFNAFVLRPEQGRAFQDWVDVDVRRSTLPQTVREVVVLTVGAAWGAAYELYAHTAVARAAGLAEETVAALCRGEQVGLSEDQRTAHAFTDALVRTHRVPDDLYAAAETAFGRDGVIDLVHLVGMYLSVSALLNAFEVPAPE